MGIDLVFIVLQGLHDYGVCIHWCNVGVSCRILEPHTAGVGDVFDGVGGK